MRSIQNQFVDFLTYKDAFDDYANNLFKERNLKFNEYMEIGDEPRFWIDGAFIFPRDEEDYWEVLNREWKLELKDIYETQNRRI